jgi:hypothetical protein
MFTDKLNSQAGVKTNLNPALFRGVPALVRLRNKVVEVSPSEAYNRIGKSSALPRAYISENLLVSPLTYESSLPKKATFSSPYEGSYRFGINNIPFPLGFAHNQNELLAIHPYHGDHRLRAILLVQWILIYSLLIASICVAKNKIQKSKRGQGEG